MKVQRNQERRKTENLAQLKISFKKLNEVEINKEIRKYKT